MILTSYFANKQLPKYKIQYSISRFTPKWFTGLEAKELAPSIELLNDYKNGLVNEEQYKCRYKEETLNKLVPSEILKKYDGSIFLCYETPDEFCHRQIVNEWLSDNGYNITEAKNKKDDIVATKIAIIGSRNYDDYAQSSFLLKRLISNYEHIELVSGGANGADSLAERFAKENNIPIKVFNADWEKYGKSAGFIRNNDIWEYADLGIAFWDGQSKGTKHSFKLSVKHSKKLFVFNYFEKYFVSVNDYLI